MMKRLIALVLSAMLLCVPPMAGLAESYTLLKLDDTGLTITLETSEAVDLQFEQDMPAGTARVTVVSAEHADVVISMMPSELYAGRSMVDLSEEERADLMKTAGMQYEAPTFTVDTTPDGNQYIHVCSNQADDIDSLFTIYKGYFVELMQSRPDFTPLTEEDEAFCYSLLQGIEFAE